MGHNRFSDRRDGDLVCDKTVKLPPRRSTSDGTIRRSANCLTDSSQTEEHAMIKRFAIVAIAAAGICVAMPAGAEEIGIGVSPGGVTVGTSHDRYRDRDREVIRERDHRDRDDTVVIRKGRDHDRDFDRDRKVIIDRDR
jgi:hypothetical protein